jgi:hypothetical protein
MEQAGHADPNGRSRRVKYLNSFRKGAGMNISTNMRSFATGAAIALASGALCWAFLHHFQLGGGDFTWSYQAARTILAGGDPYAHTPAGAIPYPLPAAIVAMPFALLPSSEIAGAVFFGLSSGLLAFGLARQSPERMLIFLAYPYWAAMLTAQWTPLIMCAAFFPAAWAFCIVKPQIGLPVGLTSFSRGGLIAGTALLVLSFLLMPRWPIEWIPQLHGYLHFFPILVLPGPLLAVTLRRWRDRDARLLLLCSVFPQRWFYDSFSLWLIPKTRKGIVATAACSWMVGLWRFYHNPHSIEQVGLWCVLGFYFPMLFVILAREWRRSRLPAVVPETNVTLPGTGGREKTIG